MPTHNSDLFADLAAPFRPEEVKTRQGGQGRILSYITARTAMNRLDDVLGPESWTVEYREVCDCLVCRLTITLPDGTVVSKEDAGGFRKMTEYDRNSGQQVTDEENTDKTGFSDALKRVAVLFGIGRYLYRDGVPQFVFDKYPETEVAPEPQAPQRREYQPAPQPQQARRDFQPAQQRAQEPRQGGIEPRQDQRPAQPQQAPRGNGGRFQNAPRSGKAMFAWVKDQEAEHDVNLLKYLNGWAKLQEFPSRMVDWDDEQVATAYAEATKKIADFQSLNQEPQQAPFDHDRD